MQLNTPHPPHLASPGLFLVGVLIGFGLVLGLLIFIDKLGTAMFHRGFAKPFYVRGRRIHHSVIYFVIPIAYGAISVLFFLGYVGFRWTDMWIHIASIGAIVAGCLVVDFVGDKFWPEIKANRIVHHEWIYSIIPAYIFTYVLVVAI